MRIRSGWLCAVTLLLCARFGAAQTARELLVQTNAALLKKGPSYKSITYRLSEDNKLEAGWLLQTPSYWGQDPKDIPYFPFETSPGNDPRLGLPYCQKDQDCGNPKARCLALKALESSGKKVCTGHSDAMLDSIFQELIQAKQSIDILSLQRDDQRFRGVLTLAAEHLAKSGKSVTIRYLLGIPPDWKETDQTDPLLLDHLTQEIPNVPGSKVTMFQARMLYRLEPKTRDAIKSILKKLGWEDLVKFVDLGSWNHSKIIAVDGRVALVGGHNLWTYDYLTTHYPVHDLSMWVRGPAAQDAHSFANTLWGYVCSSKEGSQSSRKALLGIDASPKAGCQATLTVPKEEKAGSTPILAVGNLGLWNGFAYAYDAAQASVYARWYLMDKAKTSIKISQQEIATRMPPDDPKGSIIYPRYLMQALGKALINKVDVYIVLGGDPEGKHSGYSHGIPIKDVGNAILDAARKTPGAPKEPELRKLLCERLHLANLRFHKDHASWNGTCDECWVRNHAKMWMVDDHVFYVGADNVYPAALQEFGYIVGGQSETKELLDKYWDPLWQESRGTAVSGSPLLPCMFLKALDEEGNSSIESGQTAEHGQ